MAKEPISSFVFLDLEATGLGVGKTRITELSLIAVHREAFFESSTSNIPRVLNKLTLCCYPMKRISYEAGAMTGLYNDNLYHQKDFDASMGDLISLFLKRLAPPVCLIAHNGNCFDYPLLKAELQRVGKSLPANLVCADSLLAVRDLDGCVMEEWLAKKSLQYIRVRPCVDDDTVDGDPKHSTASSTCGTQVKPSANDSSVCTPQKSKEKKDAVSTPCAKSTPRDGPPTLPCVMKDEWDEDEELAMPLADDVRDGVDPRTNTEVTPAMQMIKTVEPKKASKYIGPGVGIPVNSAVTPVVEPDLEGVQSVKRKLFSDGACKKRSGKPVKRRLFSMSESNKCDGSDGIRALNGEGDFHLGANFIIEGDSSSEEENCGGDVGDGKLGDGSPEIVNESQDSQQTIPYESEAVIESFAADESGDWEDLTGEDEISDADIVAATDSIISTSILPATSPVTPESKKPASCFTTPQTPNTKNYDFAIPSTSKGVTHESVTPNNRVRSDATPSPVTPTSSWYPPTPSTDTKVTDNVVPSSSPSPSKSPAKLSYSLYNVHVRVVGHPPRSSHRAEDDCMAMVKIFKKMAARILPWVDNHARPFADFLPLYEVNCSPAKSPDMFPYQL